ncbi:MAG: hypothetical protein NXI16_10950 [Alphaproteobacteria bacterium]|nr:hypothetical protein [Alphaproteobacteria bacterium]
MGVVALLAMLGAPSTAWAFPQNEDALGPFTAIEALLKQEEYGQALDVLGQMETSHGEEADYWVLRAYSQRKAGDIESSRASYLRALEIDPAHIRGRNYFGYLHLTVGDIAGAEAQLAFLEALCPSGCAERDDLAKAIEDYKFGDPYDGLKY